MPHNNAHCSCLDNTFFVTKLVASLMTTTAVLRLLLVAFSSGVGEREGCAEFGQGEERRGKGIGRL